MGCVASDGRMCCFQAGEPGVVVLRGEAPAREARDSDSDCELDGAPPSPCAVRFVNDNVLINGRSSMPARPDRDRIAKVPHTTFIIFVTFKVHLRLLTINPGVHLRVVYLYGEGRLA